MGLKKISGLILVTVGMLIFVVGLRQYNQARTPNQCVVRFANSLGGKSSLQFADSLRRKKLYGSVDMSLGALFFFSGGVIILKLNKKHS